MDFVKHRISFQGLRCRRFPQGLRAFALVTVLGLLTLLVTIVITFAALLRLESATTVQNTNLLIAQQNALTGLQIAVGQLQRYAGPDQAVTFPATTYYPTKKVNDPTASGPRHGRGDMFDNGTYGYRRFAVASSARSYLTNVETYLTPTERTSWNNALRDYWNANRNPRWVGVMDASLRVDTATNPNTTPVELPAQRFGEVPTPTYGEPKRDQLPVWLISGNERFNLRQGREGTDPAHTTYPAGYRTPDQPLGDPRTDSSVVYLVGTGSATDSADSGDGMDGRVKAPKVPVRDLAGQTLGNYAYWVGDESTKANFAVRDPFFESAVGSIDYRNRLQVPQRIGWENITGFGTVSFGVNDPRLENIRASSDIPLLESNATNRAALRNTVRRNFHQLTAFSKNLLTDTSLGGLKRDLTVYMESNTGLNDNDPIADRARYNPNDPRFRAWAGTNTGFPQAASTDNLPRWGQLRQWYQTESSGGGSINPTADIAPVLTYYALHGGWSYDAPNRRIRWHWVPFFVLWNPYDVSLNSASYELDVTVSPALWNTFVVNEQPTLAELQLETRAEWQDLAVAGPGQVTAPDGRPVLQAFRDGAQVKVRPYSAPGAGTVRVFLANTLFTNPADVAGSIPAGEPLTDRFYAVIPQTEVDRIAMNKGPWPKHDNDSLTRGTTDAFGRLFYRLNSADPSKVRVEYSQSGALGNRSVIGEKNAMTRLSPHWHLPGSPTRTGSRPLRFRISGSFEPGRAKVFTVPDDVNWDGTTPIILTNSYRVDHPPSISFPVLNVANGPTSLPAHGLKYSFDQISTTICAPTVRLAVNGQEICSAPNGLGAIRFNNMMVPIRGSEYDNKTGWTAAGNADDDGDGRNNRDEPVPKFVPLWRPLYATSEFSNRIDSTTGNNRLSSLWPYGTVWIQPFTSGGGWDQSQVVEFLPAFSRFNLGAKVWDVHPQVEAKRTIHHNNNNWIFPVGGGPPMGGPRLEGLARLDYVRWEDNNNQKWDRNHVSGTTGFALVTPQVQETFNWGGSQTILGLSQLSIRNARRIESEILSLGQFQQVNLSRLIWQPTFPVGNSYAGIYNDREAIAGIHSRLMGGESTTSSIGKVANDNRNLMIDLSYLLNENLWDRYFLSSIPQIGTFNPQTPLPNSRHRFRPDRVPSATEARNFNNAAAYLYNVGALNVNTTSVEAWKALLTSFRNLKLGPSGQQNPNNTVPISRTLDPVAGPVGFTESPPSGAVLQQMGANPASAKDYSRVVSGFRFLTDAMIQTLAERIVDEIRLRGPFLSLADFVNRRLVPPEGSNAFENGIENYGNPWYQARTNGFVGTEGSARPSAPFPPFMDSDNHNDFMDPAYRPFIGLFGLSGAIQRAIQVSGINGGVNHPNPSATDTVYTIRIKNRGGADALPGGDGNHFQNIPGSPLAFNTTGKHAQEPTMRSHLDSEHFAGAPAGEAGQFFDGAPGFITQGDILAMIGPALTPRGDTFIVRTYGDAVGRNGRVLARAWLEAVVQRVSDPVRPAGTTGDDQWKPNDRFGRKFEIVSLRWITPQSL